MACLRLGAVTRPRGHLVLATADPRGARSGCCGRVGAHRKDKPSTVLEQGWIDIRIVRADLFRQRRDIELDRATTTRLEVDEERTVQRAEDVARMRFAVQQLLRSSEAVDLLTRARQRAQ